MADRSRTDLVFRLGLLSLVVPVLGPLAWLTAGRALRDTAGTTPSRLVWARRLGIAGTAILVGIVALGLLGGEAVPV